MLPTIPLKIISPNHPLSIGRGLKEWLDSLPPLAPTIDSPTLHQGTTETGANCTDVSKSTNEGEGGINYRTSNLPDFDSLECKYDLERLDYLRSEVNQWLHWWNNRSGGREAIDAGADTAADGDWDAEEGMEIMREYYACLMELERRGFPITDADTVVDGEENGEVTSHRLIEIAWCGAFCDSLDHSSTSRIGNVNDDKVTASDLLKNKKQEKEMELEIDTNLSCVKESQNGHMDTPEDVSTCKTSNSNFDLSADPHHIQLERKTSNMNHLNADTSNLSITVNCNIRFEACAILYNLAVMEARLAISGPDIDITNKSHLASAVKRLDLSSTLFHHLHGIISNNNNNDAAPNNTSTGNDIDLTTDNLSMIQHAIVAQKHWCMYELHKLKPKPMHKVLSKLAMDVVENLESCLGRGLASNFTGNIRDSSLQQHHHQIFNNSNVKVKDSNTFVSSTTTTNATTTKTSTEDRHNFNKKSTPNEMKVEWGKRIQTTSLLFKARVAQHEAMLAQNKGYAMEIARWNQSQSYCKVALDLVSNVRSQQHQSSQTTMQSNNKWAIMYQSHDEEVVKLVEALSIETKSRIESLEREMIVNGGDGTMTTGNSPPSQSVALQNLPPIVFGQSSMVMSSVTSFRLLPIPQSLSPDNLVNTPRGAMFQYLLSDEARRLLDSFQAQMKNSFVHTHALVGMETDRAREELNKVNLPHSLTNYLKVLEDRRGGCVGGIKDKNDASSDAGTHTMGQQVEGFATSGGESRRASSIISPELWAQISSVQKKSTIEKIKRDLWALKDVSEFARTKLSNIISQLDDDARLDAAFRQQHASFQGHDATLVQEEPRKHVGHCEGWLQNAQNGDRVLLKMLETLEEEDQFRYLSLGREELGMLLVMEKEERESLEREQGSKCGNVEEVIETERLSFLLAELSNLFRDREERLLDLRDAILGYDLKAKFAEMAVTNGGNDILKYEQVAREAAASFNIFLIKIRENIGEQPQLLADILDENDLFMEALEKHSDGVELEDSGSDQSKPISRMLQDALDTIRRVQKQLAEGRNFYDVIMPRLDQLQTQASDISVRLTIERCDFEDKLRVTEDRRKQEMEDAEVARLFLEQAENERKENEIRDSSFAAEVAKSFREETKENGQKLRGNSSNPYADDNDSRHPNNGNTNESNLVVNTMDTHDNDFSQHDDGTSGGMAGNTDGLPPPPLGTGEAIRMAPQLRRRSMSSLDNSGYLRRTSLNASHSESGLTGDILSSPDLNLQGTTRNPPFSSNMSQSSESSQTDSNGGVRYGMRQPSTTPPAQGLPGVYHVSNFDKPPTQVDDGKLAQLVAMDFDPEKSYRALQQHDNDFDRALNELVMG